MGVLHQALEIIFEVQMKRNNEKIARRKISFPTHKTCFFFFFLDPSYFQSFYLFHFLSILNDLKCYKSATFSSTNHVWTLITTKQLQFFFGWLGLSFSNVWWFVFLNSWPPLIWGAKIFSILICFWWFLVHQCINRRGSSFFWTPKTTKSSPWIWSTLNA